MKLTKEQKRTMNTLTEDYVIQDMQQEYFQDEFERDKAEARRHFRAGYIAGLTNRNENDIEDV